MGIEIDDVDVDGRRVAWTASRIERRHATILLREAVVGRRVRIVARRTLYDGPRLKYTGATVAVSARGDLAWSRDNVVLKPVGGAARVVGAGWADGFEDGRTLRIKVLDRGPLGSLANLRSDGPRVTCPNAGEPRSLEPA